jgi:hypothetical protein
MPLRFFTGLHQPSDAKHFDAAFVSYSRLMGRKGDFAVGDWIMDSMGFSELNREQDLDKNGGPIPNDYRVSVAEYAEGIRRWKRCGNLLAAVSQDYMCEQIILDKTGMTIGEHQQKTVARYDELLRCATGVYIMPVLQGYKPNDYVHHLEMYGSRLAKGAWVGVGSICKRNGNRHAIESVLLAIHQARPDLRLHGFGLKVTALRSGIVDQLLYSADSMAWSLQARMKGKDENGKGRGNDWREAKRFTERIVDRWVQRPLFL